MTNHVLDIFLQEILVQYNLNRPHRNFNWIHVFLFIFLIFVS